MLYAVVRYHYRQVVERYDSGSRYESMDVDAQVDFEICGIFRSRELAEELRQSLFQYSSAQVEVQEVVSDL